MIIAENTNTLNMKGLMISISGMSSTVPPMGMMFRFSEELMVI
jgi:hypothetical protein